MVLILFIHLSSLVGILVTSGGGRVSIEVVVGIISVVEGTGVEVGCISLSLIQTLAAIGPNMKLAPRKPLVRSSVTKVNPKYSVSSNIVSSVIMTVAQARNMGARRSILSPAKFPATSCV